MKEQLLPSDSQLEGLMAKVPLVLFAEDDDEDWLLMSEVLEEDCEVNMDIERVSDGDTLLTRMQDTEKPSPNLVMLDLKMPRMDGLEALQEIRKLAGLKGITPVIIMTTSNLETDIVKSYKTGANSYVVKPGDHEKMGEALRTMHKYWVEVAQLPRRL